MSDIKDGGPAFPEFREERVYRCDEYGDDGADRIGTDIYVPRGGMSLRDYASAKFAAGITVASMDFANAHPHKSQAMGEALPGILKSLPWLLADAWLSGRESEPTK